jgi:hypothetical protein
LIRGRAARKKVGLELGNNAPVILEPDADVIDQGMREQDRRIDHQVIDQPQQGAGEDVPGVLGEHLSEWAPFDADRNLAAVGPVKLSTVGTPTPQVSETTVKRAEAPRLLEYSWGGSDLRWELEPLGSGTRLTLWHNIDRRFISWGAAGWHICFDVLDRLLAGDPIGRIAGAEAMKFGGWQRLNAEYAKQFGVETPGWQTNTPKR